MNHLFKKHFLFDALVIIAGALLLCIPAFYNGFPIVCSDSGTYIGACFEHTLPVDRPIAYAFFLRHFSLATSLWIPLLVQAILLASLLFFCCRYVPPQPLPRPLLLALYLLLAGGSALAATTSQLMTDVFTSALLLSLLLLLVPVNVPKSVRRYAAVIAVFSMMAHLSNLLTAAALLALLLTVGIIRRKKHPQQLKRIFMTMLLIPATFVCMLLLNRSVAGEWIVLPKGRPVFMMGRLVQTGLINDYLDENCGKKPISLCRYRDHFDVDFLWNPQSPLNQEYKWEEHGWERAAKEYDPVIRDFLSNPRNLGRFAWRSVTDAGAELLEHRIIISNFQLEGSAPYGAIAWHFPSLLDSYRHARQNVRGLDFSGLELSMMIVSGLAGVLLAALFFFRRRQILMTLLFVTVVSLLFLVLNDWVCVTFAMIDPRYNVRLLWLLPFLALLLLFGSFAEKKQGLRS